jgi:hypothetical protein
MNKNTLYPSYHCTKCKIRHHKTPADLITFEDHKLFSKELQNQKDLYGEDARDSI